MASVFKHGICGLITCASKFHVKQTSYPAHLLCMKQRLPVLAANCRRYSVFEPDGLNPEPEVPEYEALNIQMRGYDYVTLESFAKFAHNIVKNLGLESDAYAVPARTSTVQNYKPFSINIETAYNLAMYERTVQVEDIPNTLAPILMEVLQQNAPEGVNICIKEPNQDEEDFRYVPDIMLIDLQAQVEELDKMKEERRKK